MGALPAPRCRTGQGHGLVGEKYGVAQNLRKGRSLASLAQSEVIMSQATVFNNPSYYGFSNNTIFDVFNYLHPLITFLLTPGGLAGFVVFAGLMVYGWQGRYGRELLLFMAVLTGMVGYYISPYWDNTLIGPLESFRAMCKPLFVIAVAVLALKYLVSSSSMRAVPARNAAVAYLVLLAAYALRIGFAAPQRAVGGAVMALLLFLAIVQFVRRSVTTGGELAALLSAFLLAGLAFYLLSAVQLVLGAPNSIVIVGRFCGLADNPQNIAENTACMLLMANYLVLSGYSARWQKALGAVSMFVMFPFLLWTGSRTGVGMVVVGLVVMNGARIRRWVAVCVGVLAGWELYSHLFRGVAAAGGHLTSTLNDRSGPWIRGWDAFVAHPLFGQVSVNILVENSFISVAMGLGVLGLIILLILANAQIQDMATVFRWRLRVDSESRKICDFALALASALTAGMFFDAYLLAVATTQALFVGVAIALTAIAVDLVYAQRPVAQSGLEISGNSEVQYGA